MPSTPTVWLGLRQINTSETQKQGDIFHRYPISMYLSCADVLSCTLWFSVWFAVWNDSFGLHIFLTDVNLHFGVSRNMFFRCFFFSKQEPQQTGCKIHRNRRIKKKNNNITFFFLRKYYNITLYIVRVLWDVCSNVTKNKQLSKKKKKKNLQVSANTTSDLITQPEIHLRFEYLKMWNL